jgi:hypothetical protein
MEPGKIAWFVGPTRLFSWFVASSFYPVDFSRLERYMFPWRPGGIQRKSPL